MQLGPDLVGREDQRVVGDVRIGLLDDLLDALHRREVVDVDRELGGDLGLVDEVHHRLGRVDVLGLGRDHHVVGEEHRALVGVDELQVRVVALQLDDVAGVGERDPDVALGQVASSSRCR